MRVVWYVSQTGECLDRRGWSAVFVNEGVPAKTVHSEVPFESQLRYKTTREREDSLAGDRTDTPRPSPNADATPLPLADRRVFWLILERIQGSTLQAILLVAPPFPLLLLLYYCRYRSLSRNLSEAKSMSLENESNVISRENVYGP